MTVRDHSHSLPDAAAAPTPMHGYGDRRVNGSGLAVTVALHLLLLAAFLLRPHVVKQPAAPSGGAVTYVAPVAPKPKPKPRPEVLPSPPRKAAPQRVEVARLPDTITLPDEQPLPPPEPEPPKPEKVEPLQDMAAMIEARRRARGQVEQPAEESEAQRADRIARANIADANGRTHNGEPIGIGVTSMSFSTAQVRFEIPGERGRRPRLLQLTVDLGAEQDIETAVVNAMTAIIQRSWKDIVVFHLARDRKVTMSTRLEHTAELKAFLMKEHFPDYRPARR